MSGYDRTIGYSQLDRADPEKLRGTVELSKRIIDHYYTGSRGDVILDAGAGTGLEAVFLAQVYGITTVGADLHVRPLSMENSTGAAFSVQDLTSLALADACVSLIYCYHALEHVRDHVAALMEFRRILRPGGVLFVGFPNAHRLVAYIGTSQKASLVEKLAWNIQDYQHRLAGTFRNDLGAHAGFVEAEFLATASKIFEKVAPARQEYMVLKYAGLTWLWRIAAGLRLDEYLYPSNYYVCQNDF